MKSPISIGILTSLLAAGLVNCTSSADPDEAQSAESAIYSAACPVGGEPLRASCFSHREVTVSFPRGPSPKGEGFTDSRGGTQKRINDGL